MEGLIPYIMHAIRKQKPGHINRTFSHSDSSNRSYHLLLGSDSSSGSPHSSDFKPSMSQFLERRYGTLFSPRGPVSPAPPVAIAATTASRAANKIPKSYLQTS